MKKRNWLMTIAFAVLSLTIVSTMVIGTTYAKFTSTISNAGTVRAAGFLITGSTTGQAANVLIAPGESKDITVNIKYFSQVDTEITAAAAGDNTANTGAFSATNWAAIKSFFNTNYAALNTYFGITGEGAATGAMTATNPSDLITVNNTQMLTQFATNAQTAGLTTQTVDSHLYIKAMGYNESTAESVTVTVPVTWQTDTTGKDTLDTLIGNCIAALLNVAGESTNRFANQTVSGTSVTLNYGTGLDLVLTLDTAATALPSEISVNAGFTATQYTGSALTWS
ncbi:MAG: hypothetical protein IJT25_02860 [Clostridia bacterium]|nr:hypothetical protein [Clostridia bacterium]